MLSLPRNNGGVYIVYYSQAVRGASRYSSIVTKCALVPVHDMYCQEAHTPCCNECLDTVYNHVL